MANVEMSARRLTVYNRQTAPQFTLSDTAGNASGKLCVSRGGIYWKPKGAHKWIPVSYKDFGKFMAAMKKEFPVEEAEFSDASDMPAAKEIEELDVRSFIPDQEKSFFSRLFGRRK